MRLLTTLVAASVLAGAVEATAQTDQSRFFLGISGAFEPGKQTYADNGTFTLYDEAGRLDVGSEVSSGAVLDFGVGARVAGNFLVAASFHRTTSTDEATVSGQAPHPIFFNRPRSFSATVADLKRSEQGLHLSLGYRIGLTDKLDLQVLAGPSQFRFTQEVVGGVTIAEAGGALTSVNATSSVVSRKDNAWGGHVGADLSYAVYQSDETSFRFGVYARYAEAAADFLVVSNSANTKIGGTQFGAGLRVRF